MISTFTRALLQNLPFGWLSCQIRICFAPIKIMNPVSEQKELLTTNRKALTVNLDQQKYARLPKSAPARSGAMVFSGRRRRRHGRENNFRV